MKFRDIFGAEEAGIRRYSNDDKPKRAEIAPFERVRITLVTLDLQTGFGTDKKKWKCTECGFKNDVSSQKEFYETLNHIIKELVMEG